jgi:hypothetical protein
MKHESLEAQQVILSLEQILELRPLSEAEIQQRSIAKAKILGMAAVRKVKLRQ